MKKHSKLIPAVLAAAMLMSAAPAYADVTQPSTVTASFNDVKSNDFYYNAVYWAKANNITSGTSDSTYSPNQPCTRAQMVTFLWRLAGSPKSDWAASFKDVSANSPYAKAIQWADDIMLTQGTGPNTFSPNQPCTRGQMAAFLWRYNNSPQTTSDTGFADVATSDYYASGVAWAKANGITAGTDVKHYTPGRACTRGEMAAFLYRMNGSPKVTVNTPAPSVTPTPSPNPSPSPSPSPTPDPKTSDKGERVEGNENYGHWVTVHGGTLCNGCGEYFWDNGDWSYSQWLTNNIHDHGSQSSFTEHNFWVWDDVPRMEDPNSGRPFYSQEDWNNYLRYLDDTDEMCEKYNLEKDDNFIAYETKVRSMSWAKNAIAPTK